MKKSTAIASIVLTLFTSAAMAASDTKAEAPEVEVDIAPNQQGAETSTLTKEIGGFCFFAGLPPSEADYIVIRKLKVGKGTYGGVKDILPKLVDHARKIGADAIISYSGSQRFGFMPWKMVRPVVRGIAIQWSGSKGRDCVAMGGTTLETILATDKPPSQ